MRMFAGKRAKAFVANDSSSCEVLEFRSLGTRFGSLGDKAAGTVKIAVVICSNVGDEVDRRALSHEHVCN